MQETSPAMGCEQDQWRELCMGQVDGWVDVGRLSACELGWKLSGMGCEQGGLREETMQDIP